MTLLLDERRLGMLAEMGVGHAVAHSPRADVGTPPQAAPRQAGGEPVRRTGDIEQPPKPATAVPSLSPRVSVPIVASPAPLGAVASMDWDALAATVAQCRACKLCNGRTNTVFGVGDLRAEILVVGEAPGENEDRLGEPFVGQAGKLLDNMLGSLGVARGKGVYIANVLKCRPPGNRNPEPDEVAKCEPFLRRQVELLRPRIILVMGRFAVQSLLGSTEPIGRLRGRAYEYSGVPVVVTYHPAYLLRNLPDKAKAWADLCLAQSLVRATRALPSGAAETRSP
ncbi:uracil-DNA glycosylase [Ramlibacter sp.]|uniref:uracil-DNA glycosylase n=1 Tax=Ramlibacter sp. TaxID=1917967 RepID=UPI003D130DCC